MEAGVVFANEVVDNIPVHVLIGAEGGPQELYVTVRGGRLDTEPGPPSDPRLVEVLRRDGTTLEPGQRYEVGLQAEELVRAAARALDCGAVIVVDYGASAAELAGRFQGTLAAYSAHAVDDDVLAEPGRRDVTAHANWTALRRALEDSGCDVRGPFRQRAVLLALGLESEHDSLRSAHGDALRAGRGAAAVRALSRRQALGALADPGGLGGLGVLVGFRGIAAPPWLAALG